MTTTETPLHIRQAEGLRALADVLEANPELAEAMGYPLRNLLAPITDVEDPTATLGTFARVFARAGAVVRKDGNGQYFHVFASFGPAVKVDVYATREQVCERVVTGTETVTKTVPDPTALAAVPTVEVTEVVETVRWECRPLLAAEQGPAVTT